MYKNMLERAKAIESEIIQNRRTLHSFAEIEFQLPQTLALVEKELESYGIKPERCGKSGVTFTLGTAGPVILLRADMDALPMPEQTGLPFAAKNGNCHACGHDTHTAMLLGAAKLLKQSESTLKGRVKFMFQPAEEILGGAKDMLDAGILENPKVDAALAVHIAVGTEDSSSGVVYHAGGPVTFSGDAIDIVVHGKAAHGSTPSAGVDAVFAASAIVIALSALRDKEVPAEVETVVLAGKICGGTAVNTVADRCELAVSVRSKAPEYRELLLRRIKEVSQSVAATYGATAEVIHKYGMPSLVNNPELDSRIAEFCTELLGENSVKPMRKFTGSEDFSSISERVPATLVMLGAGSVEEGYEHSLHHAGMQVNEQALHVGAAVYAYAAARWMQNSAE